MTKLWNNSHGVDDVEKACDASLKDLGVDYLDLFLCHWPSPFKSGDSMFPKDGDGNTLVGDTDYVDVGCHFVPIDQAYIPGRPTRRWRSL